MTGALLTAREFEVRADGRSVPAVLWTPKDRGPRPLVLVGHGGSGHKTSQYVLDIMQPLVDQHGFAVAAIDGPVHGARRREFDAGPAVRAEFRALWARGGSISAMVADWRATLDALCALPEVDSTSIGWYGLSMGTAYGLPLVAAEPRIRAAVLGMWGTCRMGSEQLAEDAPKVLVPVLFQCKSDDEFFTVAGQEDIYRRLGTANKRLVTYPGAHTDPGSDQRADAVRFLVEALG